MRGEVSGLSDAMLAELAAITWLIDAHGRIAIEGKADVRAALGHSPDLAESLMLCLGHHDYSGPLLQLAPSDSWLKQPAPQQFRDSCGMDDAVADGEFGSTGIMFVRKSRSRWDAM
jgi:hypothetical protein